VILRNKYIQAMKNPEEKTNINQKVEAERHENNKYPAR